MANWLTLSAASVTNGDVTVSVSDSVDLSSVLAGWGLYINGAMVEIASGTAADGSGNSTLTLVEPWNGSTLTNQIAKVIPTSTPFLKGIAAMEATNAYAIKTHNTLTEIATEDKDVTITDSAGEEHTFPSLPKFLGEATQQNENLAIDYAEKAALLTISASMGYRNAVERNSGGKRTIITDSFGGENEMFVLGRRNYEDLDLPGLNLGTGTMTAFLTDGAPKSEIFISPYQSAHVNGNLIGIGGASPTGSMDFDTMKAKYAAKGAGWHMISFHEWALLELLIKKFNPDIRGNTYWGRSHASRFESAARDDGKAPGDGSGTGYVKAGSGPVSWSHDGTRDGIFDIVGNKWECVDQFKINDGQIICTPDNQPELAESLWTPQAKYFDCASNSVQLSDSVTTTTLKSTANDSVLSRTAGYTESELMRRLGVEKDADWNEGRLYVNTDGERFPRHGGSKHEAGNAGPSALYLNSPRSYVTSNFVSRSAYFAN